MRFLLISLFLVSCATHKVITHPFSKDVLFPNGKYVHHVEITTKEGKHFSLKGICQLEEKKIQVVGLSAFNTTVFRLIENRKTKAVSVEVFEDSLKSHESDIKRFYLHLRDLITLQKKAPPKQLKVERDANGNLLSVESKDTSDPWSGQVISYDDNQIADEMKIKTENFSVAITVSEYEI